MQSLARIRCSTTIERLVSHPRLPLIAGWDADRPAIWIWELTDGQVREVGGVGVDSPVYRDTVRYDRRRRTPSAAWHPTEPQLVVADSAGIVSWSPGAGITIVGVPPTEHRPTVAFSPDGRTLWMSPAGGTEGWESSLAFDFASGTTVAGPRWDTGVVAHPGGRLLATLQSDQGATLVLFSRDSEPVLRPLRRALILDCDYYETPIFSVDGRHLAVRGNAYRNSVEVFAFPSLRRVLGLNLSDADDNDSWSRHNVAFGPVPGVLWIGTLKGSLVGLPVDGEEVFEHEVLPGCAVAAMVATANRELFVAGQDGALVLMSVPDAGRVTPSQAGVAEFLAATTEASVVDMDHLDLTDGTRSWQPGDLAAVTEDSAAEPSWLRIQAAMNRLA
jgi:hypothetical protein